jgi:hypothetical protein
MEKRFDVFLSHHSVDKPWVSGLKRALEAAGLKVWLDHDEIRPGDLFVGALERALEESRAVALVVSPESVGSGWVREEYARAMGLCHGREDAPRLIPVLLRDAELPGFLASRNWVDFRDPAGFRGSVQRLRWGITGDKPPPDSPTPSKKRALLDRRLAAELVVSYPPRPDDQRVDPRSQLTNLYALALYESLLVERTVGSAVQALVMRDQGILRDSIVFLPAPVSSETEDIFRAELEHLTKRPAMASRLEIEATRYDHSKGAVSGDPDAAIIYVLGQLALASRVDAAIVCHPDRWSLYDHLLAQVCESNPAARAPELRQGLPPPAGGLPIVPGRAGRIQELAAALPAASQGVSLIRYAPLTVMRDLPPFQYEFCVATPP